MPRQRQTLVCAQGSARFASITRKGTADVVVFMCLHLTCERQTNDLESMISTLRHLINSLPALNDDERLVEMSAIRHTFLQLVSRFGRRKGLPFELSRFAFDLPTLFLPVSRTCLECAVPDNSGSMRSFLNFADEWKTSGYDS